MQPVATTVIMRHLSILIVLSVALFAFSASAQDAPEPAPAPAPAAGGDDTSAAIVTFFEGLSVIATDNTENCAEMGTLLNTSLNDHEQLLRDAAYSDSAATAEQEMAIMNAATSLGENAGQCYEEATVVTFFDRLITLTSELDS